LGRKKNARTNAQGPGAKLRCTDPEKKANNSKGARKPKKRGKSKSPVKEKQQKVDAEGMRKESAQPNPA